MHWISLVLLASFLISCDAHSGFDQPLPKKAQSIAVFPVNVRGNYFSSDSESVLSIMDSVIIKTYDFDMKCYKDSMPENFTLNKDTLSIYYVEDNFTDKQKITFLNESSFVYHEHFVDTVYKIYNASILKEYKGHFFLNDKIQTDSNKYLWDTRVLTVNKGILTMSYLDNVTEIDKMPKILSEPTDTTTYIFKPAIKKFREFAEDENFDRTDTFYRIKM